MNCPTALTKHTPTTQAFATSSGSTFKAFTASFNASNMSAVPGQAPKPSSAFPKLLLLATCAAMRADTWPIPKLTKYAIGALVPIYQKCVHSLALQDSCVFSLKISCTLLDHLPVLPKKTLSSSLAPKEMAAQEKLKDAIVRSPAICAIDYSSDWTVYLSLNTSYIAIGYILAQQMPDSDIKRYPSQFGSMLLNKCKAKYSQPKLKLYGLFCSLCVLLDSISLASRNSPSNLTLSTFAEC
jgi:hypothetical protein